jgi:hypothetical protein
VTSVTGHFEFSSLTCQRWEISTYLLVFSCKATSFKHVRFKLHEKHGIYVTGYQLCLQLVNSLDGESFMFNTSHRLFNNFFNKLSSLHPFLCWWYRFRQPPGCALLCLVTNFHSSQVLLPPGSAWLILLASTLVSWPFQVIFQNHKMEPIIFFLWWHVA